MLAKKDGAISIKAGPKQLEKINALYGKEITQAEFIKTIYPEALEVIPAEVLKEYENIRFVFGQEDAYLSNESNLIDNNPITQVIIGCVGTSGRNGPANNQFYDGKTVTTAPVASLSTTSTLEKNNNGTVLCVSSVYDFSQNTMLSYAQGYYNGTSGQYRTVSYHVALNPGYNPPSWSGTSYKPINFETVN